MDQSKKERLESRGWKVGTASDFLELTPEETILVEIKLALSKGLKERRQKLMIQTNSPLKLALANPGLPKLKMEMLQSQSNY